MMSDFKGRLQAIVELVEPEYRDQVQRDIDSILQTGAISYSDWLNLLQDQNASTDIRGTVCWTLARLDDERALPALLIACEADHPALRGEAVRALGTLGSRRAVGPLILALSEDENADVRMAAAYALGLLSDERAFTALVKALGNQYEESKVRGMAAEALADLGDLRAVMPLIAALSDKSAEVRFWASFALGEIGDPQALPELERLAATDEAILTGLGVVKEEAATAIQRIQERRS